MVSVAWSSCCVNFFVAGHVRTRPEGEIAAAVIEIKRQGGVAVEERRVAAAVRIA